MPKPRTTASRKYNEKAYDRLAITIPKGKKEVIQKHLAGTNEKVNGYVNRLLREDMGIPADEWSHNEKSAGE